MAEFVVRIDMENDSFRGNKRHEVARILRELAQKVKENGVGDYAVMDANGNKIGKAEVTN